MSIWLDMFSFCRKAIDSQRARSRTAEAQKKQLADMLKKDEIDLQDLKNELADKKEELNAANRKLHTLKGNEGLVSQPSLPLPVRLETLKAPLCSAFICHVSKSQSSHLSITFSLNILLETSNQALE